MSIISKKQGQSYKKFKKMQSWHWKLMRIQQLKMKLMITRSTV